MSFVVTKTFLMEAMHSMRSMCGGFISRSKLHSSVVFGTSSLLVVTETGPQITEKKSQHIESIERIKGSLSSPFWSDSDLFPDT